MRYVRINFTAVTPRLSHSEQRYTDADKLRSMRQGRPRGSQSGEDATRGINNIYHDQLFLLCYGCMCIYLYKVIYNLQVLVHWILQRVPFFR